MNLNNENNNKIYINNFDSNRELFETILKIPSEKRTDSNLFDLMSITNDFKIFASISGNKLHKEICKYIFLKVVSKGEVICKQGDEGDAYYCTRINLREIHLLSEWRGLILHKAKGGICCML